MTEVTRRDAIAAAAATTLASMGASVPAGAAAPAAGRRAPGWYRYTVGDLEVTVVTDGVRSFDLTPSRCHHRADRRGAEGARSGLHAAQPHDPSLRADRDQHRRQARCHRHRRRTGRLQGTPKASSASSMENLAASGIDPKSIDMVVISHFHGDHVNGLLDASNELAFPKAEVLVPEAEWKFWMDDGEMSRALGRAHGRPVQEQPPHLRCARPQGHALRLGQGDRARYPAGGDHRSLDRATRRMSSRPARARSMCRRT